MPNKEQSGVKITTEYIKCKSGFDGFVFIGEHLNGRPHGIVRLITNMGNIYEGLVTNDKFGQGFGRFIYRSGDVHYGWFKDGKPHGNGILIKLDGPVDRKGWFENG